MSQNHSTETLLENTPIRRLVFQLGIPAMFGQFFNILYSIVDRIYVGQIPEVGETALAGIVFRKLVYVACIFILPKVMDIHCIFYAGSISDAVGASFSAIVFLCVIFPRIKKEMS